MKFFFLCIAALLVGPSVSTWQTVMKVVYTARCNCPNYLPSFDHRVILREKDYVFDDNVYTTNTYTTAGNSSKSIKFSAKIGSEPNFNGFYQMYLRVEHTCTQRREQSNSQFGMGSRQAWVEHDFKIGHDSFCRYRAEECYYSHYNLDLDCTWR